MRPLTFDLKDALRGVRRDRLYAITVVITLALTVGATTAIFSIVNGVLLAPLAYDEPDRLVALREIWRFRELAQSPAPIAVNERHFHYWREHAQSFESIAQYRAVSANLTTGGDAAQMSVVRCSGSLFDVLRVPAEIGRTLTPADDPESAADVAVITDSLWKRRFSSDPAIVGRSITLDGKPYVVVGVLRPDFHLPDQPLTMRSDVFVPIRINAGWIGDHNNRAIGRLRRDSSLQRAQAELDLLQRQVADIATKEAGQAIVLSGAVIPLSDFIVGNVRRGLLLLMATVVGVLLIACSNLANLSLTRSLGRARETAVRAALGASRRRLVGSAIAEHLLLAVIGGFLGVWFASLALGLFVRTAPLDLPRVHQVALDTRVLLFALGVSVAAGLAVALIPAWRIAAGHVQQTLRANATAVAGDRAALRSHAWLLTMQVGLSVMLLIVTSLLAVSFVRVLTVDRGFEADRVLAVDLGLPGARYASEPLRQAAYDRVLASVRTLPGVRSVTTTSLLPMRGTGQTNFIAREGDTLKSADLPSANLRFVAPDFFATLGIPIRLGRSFTDAERQPDRPAPAVISERTAARMWPNQDPIGKRFSRGLEGEQGFQVVGVVAEARTTLLDEAPPLMVYLPYWWRSLPATSLLVKTATEPTAMLASIRGAVRAIDPEIAIGQSRSLEQMVETSMAGRRYQVQLFVVFGVTALFIATLGVYAVTSQSVTRRRREMNIRVALGARTSAVAGMIVWQASRPVIVGLIGGIAGALAIGGLLANLLFEVRARDPLVLLVVVTVVGTVSVMACGIATRRGLSIDPAAALRDE
jgi:predicted permease